MTTKSLSINAVVAHYKELGHDNCIKLFFRKSEVKKHSSDKPPSFFTVRPILVKVGNWFDDHINFTFVIKNKYVYLMESKDCDLWCLEIDNQTKTYKPSDDTEYEYHDTRLVFIASPKLRDRVLNLYMSSSGASEAAEDYLWNNHLYLRIFALKFLFGETNYQSNFLSANKCLGSHPSKFNLLK